MFLDRDLRDLAEAKQRLLARDALRRELFRLEWLAARTACRRALAEVRLGLDVARACLAFFRGRG